MNGTKIDLNEVYFDGIEKISINKSHALDGMIKAIMCVFLLFEYSKTF